MRDMLFLYLYASALDFVWSQDTLVTIRQGVVRGSWVSAGNYTQYVGIPYATVDPENPFGNSHEGPNFEGIFEANFENSICPQREEFNNTLIGSLDCLHINVYVPERENSSNRLPVMVYIFGGGFSIGFPGQYVYGPQYLVRHDVILVTLNYRLGPYGFMCLDIPSVPGNMGLKDQQTALRWVKENIEAFGGDENSITLFGNSAGSISVELHVFSPNSSDLFTRAIMQSGTSLLPSTFRESNTDVAMNLATYFGFKVETVKEALQILKNIMPLDLVEAAEDLGISFGPCLEKPFQGVYNFMRKSPHDILSYGEYNSVPLLIGYNNDESGHFIRMMVQLHGDYLDEQQNQVHNDLNTLFRFDSQEMYDTAGKIMSNYYYANKILTNENLKGLVDYSSDSTFVVPTERSVMFHYNNSNNPIYKYVFAYNGNLNFWVILNNITEPEGAGHADEIGYLFKLSYVPEENITPDDQLIVDRMTTMWANFAKYGDPTPEVTELLPVRWLAVTEEAQHYLWIDSDIYLDQQAFHERVAFRKLFLQAYGKYEITSPGVPGEAQRPTACLSTTGLLIIIYLYNHVF